LYIGIKGGSDEQKGLTAEEIINKLHEAEVLQSKGQSLGEVVRQLGVSDATYYKWRKEYGGLRVDQAKRFKELEAENQRLRKVVAELSIDSSILKEAAWGNF
jgi:putative transposase